MLAEAVPLGVMTEPPHGEPAFPPLLAALARLDTDLFSVVEQDLHPVEPHIPLPIGARTAGYLRGCGLGSVRRWPYLPPIGTIRSRLAGCTDQKEALDGE